MRFCFIIEERYRHQPMPIVIADQLRQWGHDVDLLEPKETVTYLSELPQQRYDAYVLKTSTDGPGLSILEAAEAIGIPTINNSRSIRLVRDKAVAAAFAHEHGLPVPHTYFVAHSKLLTQVPEAEYPIVVKPCSGSYCRDIYRLNSSAELATLKIAESNEQFFLAQHYTENTGFDIKLYVTGEEVRAVVKKSPLHSTVKEGRIPVTPALKKLAIRVGRVFGLDIFGLDVVETPDGLVLLDINDFPSFGMIPRAVATVSEYVLHAAKRAELKYSAKLERHQQRLAVKEKML